MGSGCCVRPSFQSCLRFQEKVLVCVSRPCEFRALEGKGACWVFSRHLLGFTGRRLGVDIGFVWPVLVFLWLALKTSSHILTHAACGRHYATGRKSEKILPFFVWRAHVCVVLMRLRECLFGHPSFGLGLRCPQTGLVFFTGKYALGLYRAKVTRESSGCRSEKVFFLRGISASRGKIWLPELALKFSQELEKRLSAEPSCSRKRKTRFQMQDADMKQCVCISKP